MIYALSLLSCKMDIGLIITIKLQDSSDRYWRVIILSCRVVKIDLGV